MKNIEWCYKTGQIVTAELDEDYGFDANEKFEIVKKELDDNEQIYTLKNLNSGNLYEAYSTMICDVLY